MAKVSKKLIETRLNSMGCPLRWRVSNGGKCPDELAFQFGTWLKKNDPILFGIYLANYQQGDTQFWY